MAHICVRKTKRSLAAMAAAVLLLLGVSIPAMAEQEAYDAAAGVGITVYLKPALGETDTSDPDRFVVYQVLSGTISDTGDDGIMADVSWGNGVDWQGYVSALQADGRFTDAIAYIERFFASPEAIGDMSSVFGGIMYRYPYMTEPMAAIAAGYALEPCAYTQWEQERVAWSFSVPTPGYYLVIDTYVEPAEGAEDDTAVPVILRITETQQLDILSFTPKLARSVNGLPGAIAETNEPFSFSVLCTMPYDIADYTTFPMDLHEHLDPGLIADMASIQVTIDAAVISAGDDTYAATAERGEDGSTDITVHFPDLKGTSMPPLKSLSSITVTYDAIIGPATEPATGMGSFSQLSYSLATDGSGSGLSIRSYTKAYNAAMDINTDAGSQYIIRDLSGKYCKLSQTGENTWRVEDWLDDPVKATVLTQPEDGQQLRVVGLGSNYYILHEQAPPDGWQPFDDLPFYLSVSVDDNGDITDSMGIINDIVRGETCDYASMSSNGCTFSLSVHHEPAAVGEKGTGASDAAAQEETMFGPGWFVQTCLILAVGVALVVFFLVRRRHRD